MFKKVIISKKNINLGKGFLIAFSCILHSLHGMETDKEAVIKPEFEFNLQDIKRKMDSLPIIEVSATDTLENKASKIMNFLVSLNSKLKEEECRNYLASDFVKDLEGKILEIMKSGRPLVLTGPYFAFKSLEEAEVIKGGECDLGELLFLLSMRNIADQISKIHPCRIRLLSDALETLGSMRRAFGEENFHYKEYSKVETSYRKTLAKICSSVAPDGKISIEAKDDYQCFQLSDRQLLEDCDKHKFSQEEKKGIEGFAKGFAARKFPDQTEEDRLLFSELYFFTSYLRAQDLKTETEDEAIRISSRFGKSSSNKFYLPSIYFQKSSKLTNFQHTVP